MQNNQNYVGGQIKVDLKQTAQGGGRGGGTAVDAKYIHLKTVGFLTHSVRACLSYPCYARTLLYGMCLCARCTVS